MKLNGSDILINVLLEHGVDTIFGYPGGAVLNIYDALYKYQDKINHILTAHEQGAAHAADGYARATGKTGVVLATSGPGATNLVTGIATAYMDSVPMVAITGNVGRSLIGRDSFQEVYIAGITMPITKHNFVVRDVSELADTLRAAFKIAHSDRPGPVLVDIPKDITAAVHDYIAMPPDIMEQTFKLNKNTIEQVAQLINDSKKPVVYFGGGVISSEASEILIEFLEKANIPACHTMMGIGGMDRSHPLCLGMVGMHGKVSASYAADNADVLIAIGARFSDRVATKQGEFAKESKIIHIDIDDAEIGKNVGVNYNLVADVKFALSKLLPLIEKKDRTEWFKTIDEYKTRDYTPENSDTILKPHQIMDAVSKQIGHDGIVVTDVGQHQMWAAQYCDCSKPRSFLTSGGLGTMGFGLGAAIGAKTACPNKPVAHITGDGSFHMNLNEIATCVSYKTPLVTVLLNNNVLGMVFQWQTSLYDKRYSSTVHGRKTDYVKLAEAFGATGFRCRTKAELEKALDEAYKLGTYCIIECLIHADERVLPMIPAGGTVDEVIMK